MVSLTTLVSLLVAHRQANGASLCIRHRRRSTAFLCPRTHHHLLVIPAIWIVYHLHQRSLALLTAWPMSE
jgi:hypothetical protein